MTSPYLASSPSVNVRVLFFGAVAAAVGERETEIELDFGSTVGDAHVSLFRLFPKLERLKVMFAVDQEHCSGSYVVADGDELAIFTAVSGG